MMRSNGNALVELVLTLAVIVFIISLFAIKLYKPELNSLGGKGSVVDSLYVSSGVYELQIVLTGQMKLE